MPQTVRISSVILEDESHQKYCLKVCPEILPSVGDRLVTPYVNGPKGIEQGVIDCRIVDRVFRIHGFIVDVHILVDNINLSF